MKLFLLLCCLGGALLLARAQTTNREAQLFALSTGYEDASLAFAPDGKTAWFRTGIAWTNLQFIVFSELRNGRWSEPEMAAFSGRYRDSEPFVAPDGKRLFFSSSRITTDRMARSNFDIWVVEKTANGWGEPANLGAPINTTAHETSPSITADGTLYFDSSRPGGRGALDIYAARWMNDKYAEPENLGDAINSTAFDANACFDARNERLFFASNREGGVGAWDIYVSVRRNGRWEAARNLGSAVNSHFDERWPALSPDGRYLYFASQRPGNNATVANQRLIYAQLVNQLRSAGNGSSDLYRIELSVLKLDQP